MSFYRDIKESKTLVGTDFTKDKPFPPQVRGTDKAKNISPVLSANPKAHPFKGKFVGGESVNSVDQLFYAKLANGQKVYARPADQKQIDQLQQQYAGAEIKLFDFNRPDVQKWLEARRVNLRKFVPGMVQTMGESVVEEEALMEGPEERIKANPAYVNGVLQHLMHDATVPVSIEHQLGLKPDPQKAMDIWLKFLDKLNAEGHDGIPMSTNKKYHEWLTKIYAQKATPFEDIHSRAPQALYQHEVMRRRNLLRPEHTDVNRFSSVSQLEHVLDRLYREQLRKVLEDEKLKEIIKNAKAVHLVSNDQYDIYIPLNRGAGCKYGKGTRWCTASTSSSNYYDRYSRQGYLYIVMPKGEGDEGKFQFHLESDSFMDSADNRASWETIRQRFPNLKKDVMAGLAQHPELNLTPEEFNSKIKGGDRWYGLRRYFDTITQDENN